MEKSIERRRFPRVSMKFHLRYRRIQANPAGFRNALAEDFSEGGFRFRTQEILPHRASFLLELHLPGFKPVRSLARAAWVRVMPENDGYEIGGRFVEPTYETRTAISRQLAQHVRESVNA